MNGKNPQRNFCWTETLELGLYDAVARFSFSNSDKATKCNGHTPGKYSEAGCKLYDQLRIHLAEHKSQASTKKRQRVIEALKRKDDQKQWAEVLNDAAGLF